MVKTDNTEPLRTTGEDGKDLKSHQDYSHWVITGNRWYVTYLNGELVNSELEEVISVEGELVFCEDCNKVRPSLKPTYNTPSFHASASGICIDCEKKWCEDSTKDGLPASVISEEDIMKQFWLTISENGLAEDFMNMASVYPDNLGKDDDGEDYTYEAGDPVTWDQFSIVFQQKILKDWNGIKCILEKLHDENCHVYCQEEEGYCTWSDF